MKSIITICCLSFFGYFLQGQEIQLEPLGGPENATIGFMEANQEGHIIVHQKYRGLFRSKDLGNSWTEIPFSTSKVNPIVFFTTHPNNDFYFSNSDDIFKINPDSDIPIEINTAGLLQIHDIEVDDNGILFVLDKKNDLFKTENDGEDWVKLTNRNLDSQIRGSSKIFVPKNSPYVYFNQSDYTLFRINKDGGTTEVSVDISGRGRIYNIIKNNANNSLLLSRYGGLFVSEFGTQWDRLNTPFVPRAGSFFKQTGEIVSIAENEYFQSGDLGISWQLIENKIPCPIGWGTNTKLVEKDSIFIINQTSSLPSDLFAVSENFSEWTELKAPDNLAPSVRNIYKDSKGNIFVGSMTSQGHRGTTIKFQTSDKNENKFDNLLIDDRLGIKGMTVLPSNDILAVAENDSLYLSENQGGNWNEYFTPNFRDLKDIKSNKSGVIVFNSSWSGGFWISNVGNDWKYVETPGASTDFDIHPNGDVYFVSKNTSDPNDHIIRYNTNNETKDTLLSIDYLVDMFISKTGLIIAKTFKNSTPHWVVSEDNGDTFYFIESPNFYQVTSAKNGYILRLSYNIISISKNNGLSFETILELDKDEYTGTGIHLDDENYLYVGFRDLPLHKSTEPLSFGDNFIVGKVYLDENQDCLYDSAEIYLPNVIVTAAGQDTFYVNTRSDGYFSIPLPPGPGTYDVSVALADPLWEPCDSFINISFSGVYDTAFIDFPIKQKLKCALLEVDLTTPRVRRCFENKSYVSYCNYGNILADSADIEITLDPRFQIESASIPWAQVANNIYNFSVGEIDVFECRDFWFITSHDCDSVALGETICMQAHIYPDSLCEVGEPRPLLKIDGNCFQDSVRFTIKNTGTGSMLQPRQYIIIEDVAIMRIGDPFLLPPGEELPIEPIAAHGQTIHLTVQKSENQSDKSQPSLTIEGCGSPPHSFGLFNQIGHDDDTPFLDIECRSTIGSYDPNDKSAVPTGWGTEHKILPNKSIEYLIRFQNTGTDTAFTVRILDTLSNWLDVTTFQTGASSHDYRYEISDQGTVNFIFNNIMLPDSNINEAASNGFVKYKIAMKTDLPHGTEILNDADIFFDFNPPIRTNETFHVIDEPWVLVKTGEVFLPETEVKIYPNPFSETAILELKSKSLTSEFQCRILDISGKQVSNQISKNNQITLNRNNLNSGIYFYQLIGRSGKIASGKVVIK